MQKIRSLLNEMLRAAWHVAPGSGKGVSRALDFFGILYGDEDVVQRLSDLY